MKKYVEFIAHASVTRVVEVEVPEGTSTAAIEAKAAAILEKAPDLDNEGGQWSVNRLEPASIAPVSISVKVPIVDTPIILHL